MSDVVNVWNDRLTDLRRPFDPARPWYAFAAKLLSSAPRAGLALDVGCGVGEFLGRLRSLGWEAQGVDGHAGQVERVRAAGFRAECADLEGALPFPAAQFQLVTCLEVIEHVARAENLMSEMHRVLAPGGRLLLSTPNHGFWRSRMRALWGFPPVNEGVHLRFFTAASLRALARAAGFEVQAQASFGPWTGWNVLRRVFGLSDAFMVAPAWAENWLACDLVLLLARGGRPA